MRWTGSLLEHLFRKPALNETRIRSGFLFLPMTIGGETRWLERASWVEKYQYLDFYLVFPEWSPEYWMGPAKFKDNYGKESSGA